MAIPEPWRLVLVLVGRVSFAKGEGEQKYAAVQVMTAAPLEWGRFVNRPSDVAAPARGSRYREERPPFGGRECINRLRLAGGPA